jgi:hypothetical protein
MLLQQSSNKHGIFYVLTKRCEGLLVDKFLECRSGLKERHLSFVASWKLLDQSGIRAHSLMKVTNFENEFIPGHFCNNVLCSISPNLLTAKQH